MTSSGVRSPGGEHGTPHGKSISAPSAGAHFASSGGTAMCLLLSSIFYP